MNRKTNKRTLIKTAALTLALLYLLPGILSAGEKKKGRVTVTVRFYEGFRDKKQADQEGRKDFYLKKLNIGNVMSKVSVYNEKNKLKKIFNLTEIKVLSVSVMNRDKKARVHRSTVRLPGGRRLSVNLFEVDTGSSKFKAEVRDSGSPSRVFLESEIIMPPGKPAVLGFEDPDGNIYFISFLRETGPGNLNKPKLIKRVPPDYPQEALDSGLEGNVLLEGSTDTEGNVIHARVIQGVEGLNEAALTALKKWKYAPFIVDGKKKAVIFTVMMRFRAKEDKAGEDTPKKTAKKEQPGGKK